MNPSPTPFESRGFYAHAPMIAVVFVFAMLLAGAVRLRARAAQPPLPAEPAAAAVPGR